MLCDKGLSLMLDHNGETNFNKEKRKREEKELQPDKRSRGKDKI